METAIVPRLLHTRRDFCARACQAAAMLAAGGVAGCGGSATAPSSTSTPQLSTVTATVAGRVVSLTIDSGAPVLASVGAAVVVQTSLGTFLVSRMSQDAFIVLTATCTHEGCMITGFSGSRYVCPCHGSQFATSGSVLMGPASKSLQQYPTQFTNGVLTFTV